MYDVLGWIGTVCGYIIVATVVATIAHRMDDSEPEFSQFVGAVWPVSISVFAVCATIFGTFCLVKNAKMPSLPKFKTAEQKVIEYSQSPVKVLTEIICAKILANPESLVLDTKSYRGAYYYQDWTSPDGKIKVRASHYHIKDDMHSLSSVLVNEKSVEVETDKVLKALNKAKKFNEDKKKADAEAAKQIAALEAVESLLLQPETK